MLRVQICCWSVRHLKCRTSRAHNLSAVATQYNSLPFLPPASRFSALWLGHAQKSKFWMRKWPTSLGFSIFGIFFRLSVFSFSFLFAAVIALLLGLLAVKKLLRKRHRDGPGVVAGNFALSFSLNFLSFFVQSYLRLHSADHSDLGIIGKIFSSCRSWV